MKNIKLSHLLFTNAVGSNIIADETSVFSYSDLISAITTLNKHLDKLPLGNVRCISVNAQNNVGHIIVMLSLIIRQTNFFLSTQNISRFQAVPDFCDQILSIGKAGIDIQKIADSIELTKNVHAVEAGRDAIKPNAGMVIFSSSGTTGTPKYVCHRSNRLIRNAQNCIERFGFNSRQTLLVPVPINHMFGFGVGFLPSIISGASVCFIEKNNIIKLLDKHARFIPDFTLVTPTVCKMLLILKKGSQTRTAFIVAGDHIKKDIYREFELKYGKLINLYGCTEMGAIATSPLESGADDHTYGSLIPLNNVNVRVDGVKRGEIICEHNAGFDFYVDRSGKRIGPEKTEPEYRAKDLGELTTGNAFNVIGRIDNCTNRNGFLVSLREIEMTLEDAFAEVNNAIVFESDSDSIMGNRLIAVCELKDGNNEPGRHVVNAICKTKMPNHWIPDKFYFVSELPKLTNGKPDRVLLKKNYALTTINN